MNHDKDIQNYIFEAFFKSFSSDKMTLCNIKDQPWFSDTLTSARPLSGSGFNTSFVNQQMLMHRIIMLNLYIANAQILSFNSFFAVESSGAR